MLEVCPSTVTTTGLLMPSPTGNLHWMLVWVWDPPTTGQSCPPTVTLPRIVPKFVPSRVTVPVPAVLASFDSETEAIVGGA